MSAGAAVEEGVALAPVLAVAERLCGADEKAAQQRQLDEAALVQLEQDHEALKRRRGRLEGGRAARLEEWRKVTAEAEIGLEMAGAIAALDILEELRIAIAALAELHARIVGMTRDADGHDRAVTAAADSLAIAPSTDVGERLKAMRERLLTARSNANLLRALEATVAGRVAEAAAANAELLAAADALKPLMDETAAQNMQALSTAIERSRAARALRIAVLDVETAIKAAGDGKGLEELLADVEGVEPDGLAAKTEALGRDLAQLNNEVAVAAAAHGDAGRAFTSLAIQGDSAVDAAANAEAARAELGVLAEEFVIKRAQAVTLRWAIEQYRERNQDPLLARASLLFKKLTVGRYAALRIDSDGSSQRLLGLRDDGRKAVDVGGMSEGTTDQLFLALRIAAVEQSAAGGVSLPFLADDLFVNFDDSRSEAGFRVLAETGRVDTGAVFHPSSSPRSHCSFSRGGGRALGMFVSVKSRTFGGQPARLTHLKRPTWNAFEKCA